jgi:molybdopterin-guanine dinucleotide biosynthesis protein A
MDERERAEIVAKTADPAKRGTLGVILAGGEGRRMGGADKALLPLAGKPLLAHVMARLGPLVGEAVLSANGDPARFVEFGLIVLADPLPGRPGPLAGMLAAMLWARTARPAIRDILSAPVDTPFLPPDLLARLAAARAAMRQPIACAASLGREHPAIALIPVTLADDLARWLARGERRVSGFLARHGYAVAAYEGDPFRNINTPEELQNQARDLAS